MYNICVCVIFFKKNSLDGNHGVVSIIHAYLNPNKCDHLKG